MIDGNAMRSAIDEQIRQAYTLVNSPHRDRTAFAVAMRNQLRQMTTLVESLVAARDSEQKAQNAYYRRGVRDGERETINEIRSALKLEPL